MQTIEGILDQVTRTAASPGVRLPDLAAVAQSIDLSDEAIEAVVRTDPTKPYGRRVLLANDHVESMIARWTRRHECAPHDHGGSYGAVRLLQGSALHTVWQVRDGALHMVRQDVVHAGFVLTCGPEMVHSMVDAGAEAPLTTLHLYIDPIDHMFVYDTLEQGAAEATGSLGERRPVIREGRTWVVDGGCGAWLPHGQPELVREIRDGLLRPRDVRATWSSGT
jgi:cysteine dioxygenase